jgi:hypothetical protein
VAEGQHAFFDGANAVETPLGVDDGLSALALGESLGSRTGEEFVGERFVGGESKVQEPVLPEVTAVTLPVSPETLPMTVTLAHVSKAAAARQARRFCGLYDFSAVNSVTRRSIDLRNARSLARLVVGVPKRS